MPLYNPSQYSYDNKTEFDHLVIINRNIFYKLFRELFLKDKVKIKVKLGNEYKFIYQEDCILLYEHELASYQFSKTKIPCIYVNNNLFGIRRNIKINSLEVCINNIIINFDNNHKLIIDSKQFYDMILKSNENMKSVQTKCALQDKLKYTKYTGQYFLNIVKKYDINYWKAFYCECCGNPIVFKFTSEKILIDNQCCCNNVIFKYSEMSYNDFALWYHTQTNSSIIKQIENFWIKGR